MLASVARAAFLAVALIGAAAQCRASAGDLADFNAAAEQVESHNRVAIGYLRTGNVDLASIELDRLRDAWGDIAASALPANGRTFSPATRITLCCSPTSAMRLVTADMMLNSGHPEVARQALHAVRTDFYDLRRSAGVQVLADCIYDANTAMDALMVYNEPGLDWSTPTRRPASPARPRPTAMCSTVATRWRVKQCARIRNSAG